MTIQIVNTGTSANSGNGDSLRTAFTKINNNFRELSDIVGNIDRIEDVIGNLLSTSTQTGISITYNSTTNVLSLSVIPATTSTIGGVIVGSGLSVTNSGQLSANFGDIVITNNVISTKNNGQDIILNPAGTAGSGKVRIVNHGLQFDNGTGGPYTGHLIYTNPTSSAGIGVGESNNSIRISGDTVTLGLIADFGLYNAIRGTWNSLITMDYFGNLVINDGNLIFGNNGIQFSDGSTQYTAYIPGESTSIILSGTTPPAGPVTGTTWYDPTSGRLFIYYDNYWVDASPSGSGPVNQAVDRLVNGSKEVILGANGTLTVQGDIIPSDNLSYNLGSTSSQWHSIYVGTGTIYIGGVALGVNTSNYVTINGNPIITSNTAGNITLQGGANISPVTVSDTAPIATTGTQWFNTIEGRNYVAWNNLWIDSNPTQVLSPETYLDGLAIDGTTISTTDINSDAIVIDGGNNTKLTVGNNNIKIQTAGGQNRQFWVAEYGGITNAVTTSSFSLGTGAFYDSQGNVYILGAVQYGELNFNDVDSLLLKYDTNGNLLWSRTWHDNGGGNCGAINQAFAIDSNDRIYWLATDVTTYTCWTGYMDTDGNLGLGGIAQQSLGYIDAGLSATDIACDNSGNYYIAGAYYYSGETPVVIKVNGDSGDVIWTGNIIPEDYEDLPSTGRYRAVTVNPTSGDVWAIGDYNGGNGVWAMLSKWDINGIHQWTKKLVTQTGDIGEAVIFNSGYVYTIVNDDSEQKAVVSKFDTDGDLVWASDLAVGVVDPIANYLENTGAYDLSFDSTGNIYVTGVIPYINGPQLWITKLNPANGEMLYSRILVTTLGSFITDGINGGFTNSTGHRVGDIYQDKIAVTAMTPSDINDNTSTTEARVMVAQLPIDGSIVGTFDNVEIVDITDDLNGICSTGTYTVTTLIWSTGTAETLESTSSLSVSYITDIIGLTGETIVLGSVGASTTSNTWTFINNNIVLPPDGDILDSNGNSVLGGVNGDYTPTTPADWLGSPTVGTVAAGLDELASRVVDIENTPVAPVTTSTLVNGTYTVALSTSGVLTLSTASTILGNSTDPNVYIETSTTATTSTWTFGTNGILTLPAATPIIKGGGTGTDVTIIASTGSNTSTWVFAASGDLTFPDATVQTTAWTGSTDRLTSTGTSVVLNKDQYNTSRLTFTGSATIETAGYLSSTGGLALVDSSSQQYVIAKSNRVQITTGFPDQGTGLESYNEWWFQKNGVFKLPTTGIIENNGKQWTFSSTGTLKLPEGGDIKDSTGTSILDRLTSTGTSVVLTKDQYNTSRLTFTGGATIETAGYITDTGGLALVDSSAQQYVTANTLRVQITTGFPDQGTGLDSFNDWWFQKNGVLKIPTTGIIENNGKQWTFSSTGTLTLPASGGLTVSGAVDLQGATTVKDVRDTVYTSGVTTGTITPSCANGGVQTITLTGSITLNAFASPVAGQTMTLIIKQPSSGGPYTLTSSMLFAGGSKTLSTAANAIDMLTISYIGGVYYASLVTGFA